eukprot:6490959-Amphidinium_carterae.3
MTEFRNSVLSITSDMGTELGITDFRQNHLSNLQPPWKLFAAPIETDEHHTQQVEQVSSFVFPNAMPVAGIMHISTNALADVHAQLTHYRRFLQHASAIESLLAETARYELFLATCVKPTEHRHLLPLFSKLPKYYPKRFLRQTSPSPSLRTFRVTLLGTSHCFNRSLPTCTGPYCPYGPYDIYF